MIKPPHGQRQRVGHNIGALCNVDKEPREFSAGEQKILENLASIAVEELEKGLP